MDLENPSDQVSVGYVNNMF